MSQKSTSKAAVVTAIAVILLAASTASTLEATEWQAWIGAQSRDLGGPALVFLPNELWVQTNDSIRWTLTSTETHTVTFLMPGQVRTGLILSQRGAAGARNILFCRPSLSAPCKSVDTSTFRGGRPLL